VDSRIFQRRSFAAKQAGKQISGLAVEQVGELMTRLLNNRSTKQKATYEHQPITSNGPKPETLHESQSVAEQAEASAT